LARIKGYKKKEKLYIFEADAKKKKRQKSRKLDESEEWRDPKEKGESISEQEGQQEAASDGCFFHDEGSSRLTTHPHRSPSKYSSPKNGGMISKRRKGGVGRRRERTG
jgi:hypothetical protein